MDIIKYGSILASIVLLIVGLVKLPFVKFKSKKFYKAGFTIFTFLLTVGLSVLCQNYILCKEIISISMAYLLLSAIAQTFFSYNGVYEGLGLKKLVKILFEKIKELLAKNPENKLSKLANKVGLEKASELISSLVAQKEKEEEIVIEEKQEEVVVKETPNVEVTIETPKIDVIRAREV